MGGNRRVSLLRQRNFRLLWIGETISQLGNAMAVVGVPLVAVIVLHASTFTLGVLTAAAWLPWLVIGLPAGAWVDRLPARGVMIVSDVISAVLYASVPVTAWAGVLTTGLVIGVARHPRRVVDPAWRRRAVRDAAAHPRPPRPQGPARHAARAARAGAA